MSCQPLDPPARGGRRSTRVVGAMARAGLGVVLLAACGVGGTTPTGPDVPPRNVVSAYPSLEFTPAEIRIAAGDSVTWAFGGVPHSVVFQAEDEPGDHYGGHASDRGAPPNIARTTNGSVARTFETRGSFHYRCALHPGMVGEVRVE